MNPFDWFDGIFVINLKRSTERLELFKQQAQEYGFIDKLRVFTAIEDSVGSYGCSLSHNEIFKMAKKENLKNILVFEDDSVFLYPKEYVYEQINNAITTLDSNWDILYIGTNVVWPNHTSIQIKDNIVVCDKSLGRFGICYRNTCYDYFLSIFPSRERFIQKPSSLRGDVLVSKSPLKKYGLRFPVVAPSSKESFTSSGAKPSLDRPSNDGYFHFLLIMAGYINKKMINSMYLKDDIRKKLFNDYNSLTINKRATCFRNVILNLMRNF